jgi:ComF family protein
MRGFRELIDAIFDVVFPPICLSCETIIGEKERILSLCTTCRSRFKTASGFFCPVCGGRLPTLRVPCHEKTPFVLATPFSFADPVVQKIIHLLKYGRVKRAALPLAFFIVSYLQSVANIKDAGYDDFTMIPVPLYSSRERKRGFNQSLLIAQEMEKFSKALDGEHRLPNFRIEAGILVRVRKTAPQIKQSSRKARAENVRGCFTIRDASKIAGKNIFLVDDVFTSGATIGELARILKANGAKKIIALVAAKA